MSDKETIITYSNNRVDIADILSILCEAIYNLSGSSDISR